MTRPVLATRTAFARATLDKVERLLEVLAALREDPILGDAFVLYGGTALNVFLDHLPRLSVDIDLMYAGSPDLDGMRGQRPIIDARLREVVGRLGYTAKSMNDEHSGQTYRLRYGDDYLKIDVSYLARVPLLEPQEIACAAAEPRVAFPVLDLRELIAGKVKALMEREAARDLYDLARLGRRDPKRLDDPLARALVVRAVSSADTFPAISGPAEALDKFAYPSDDVIEPLRAMLAPPTTSPTSPRCVATSHGCSLRYRSRQQTNPSICAFSAKRRATGRSCSSSPGPMCSNGLAETQ